MSARPLIQILLALAGSLLGPNSAAPAADSPEYLLKATWVYNFAKYCEWPTLSPEEPIAIGVLGENPFGESLDKVTRGKMIETHPLTVKRGLDLESLGSVHVLFVAASEKDRLGPILRTVGVRPSLTISDVPGFAKLGGMVTFWVESDSIRFHVNSQAAQAAGLRIRAQLLKLSKDPPPPRHQAATP